MIDGSTPSPTVLALYAQLKEEGNVTAGLEMLAHGIVQEEGWKQNLQNAVNSANNRANDYRNKMNDANNKANDFRNKMNDANNKFNDINGKFNNMKNDLNNKVNGITDKYNKVKDTITSVQDSVQNVGGCLAKLPNSATPFQEITAIGKEFKASGASGVRSRLMTKTISPFMDQATDAVDGVVDGMQNISESMQNLFQQGKLNPAVISALPAQVINLIVMQRVNFPVLDCLLGNNGFMSDVSKVVSAIGPFIVSLAERTRKMLKTLMARLVGPKSPFGKFMIKLAKEKATKFLPKLEVVETRIGNAVQDVCQKNSRKLLAIAEGTSDSKAKATLCAKADQTSAENKEMMVAAFTEAMTGAADFAIAALNEHVWMPLLQSLTAMAISAEDFIMQVVDGAAGLIPEVGGIIATSITSVVSQVGAKITETLASDAVTGVSNGLSSQIRTQAPIWANTLADSIQKQTDAIAAKASASKDKAVAAKDKAVAPVLTFAGNAAPLAAPVMLVLGPLMTQFADTALPTITKATTTCAADIKSLNKLVRASVKCPA